MLPGAEKLYGGYMGLYTALLHAGADTFGWPRDRLKIRSWDVVGNRSGENGEEEKGFPALGDVDAVLVSGSREFLFCVFFWGFSGWTEEWGSFLSREMDAASFPVTCQDIYTYTHTYKSIYPSTQRKLTIPKTAGYSAFETAPWLLRLLEFVRAVLAQTRVRLLGVCFGLQVIAHAMGATVARNALGFEVSVCEVQLTERGRALFDGRETLVGYNYYSSFGWFLKWSFPAPPPFRLSVYLSTSLCLYKSLCVHTHMYHRSAPTS